MTSWIYDTLNYCGQSLYYGGWSIAAVSSSIILLGFGSAGIGAGTAAAAIQSTFPYIAKGSYFAFLQSVGAKGIFTGFIYKGAIVGATGSILSATTRN